MKKEKGLEIDHPAKYSDVLMPIFDKYLPKDGDILDPFAGTGKLKQIRPNATLLEIEPEWAKISGAIVGDATNMPFPDSSFDAICTSPTYGNRMADNFVDHQKSKGYKRHTYRHYLNRELSPNNSGGMQWGDKYKELHIKAWGECYRVLRNGGIFVLNISDHIRGGKVINVSDWHKKIIQSIGFELILSEEVITKRQKHGANSKLRVDHEDVIVFLKK